MATMRKVSLSDVKNAFPKESEEEGMVMNHIEDTNPITNGSGEGVGMEPLPMDFVQSMIEEKEFKAQQQRKQRQFMSEEASETDDDFDVEQGQIKREVKARKSTIEEELDDSVRFLSFRGGEMRCKSHNRQSSIDEVHDEFELNDAEDFERRILTAEDRFAMDARFSIAPTGKLDDKKKDSTNRGQIDLVGGIPARRLINYKATFRTVKIGFCFIILPAMIASTILFYCFRDENRNYVPPCYNGGNVGDSIVDAVSRVNEDLKDFADMQGSDSETPVTVNETNVEAPSPSPRSYKCEGPTFSRIFMILCIQTLTFGLSLGLQSLLVQICRDFDVKCFGVIGRLFVLRGKGIPLTFIFWGLVNLILIFIKFHNLPGKRVSLFDEALNPSKGFAKGAGFRGHSIMLIVLGFAITTKRLVTGLRNGKASFSRYASRVSNALKQSKIIAQVSQLPYDDRKCSSKVLQRALRVSPALRRNTANASQDNGLDVDELLGGWEEFDTTTRNSEQESAKLSAIVQFRHSVSMLNSNYPFSPTFGRAINRKDVLEHSQEIYSDLLDIADSPVVNFRILAFLAMDEENSLDEELLKDLVSLFRPERDGSISMLNFCKSIDMIYKELRKLRASIENEAHLNSAAESIQNAIFYAILTCVYLMAIRVRYLELLTLLVFLSVTFSFCLGGAAGNFVEGVLLVIAQRPYDIGDRIAITSPSEVISGNGRPKWVVQDVSLYHTTLVFDRSQEYATIPNSSLSGYRIINAARSHRAQLNFTINIDIDKTDERTIESFKRFLCEYIKSKPREWVKPISFRMNEMAGRHSSYVEFLLRLQHRESWQQIEAIEDSRSDLRKFCFNLQKRLGMRIGGGGEDSSSQVSAVSKEENDEDGYDPELSGYGDIDEYVDDSVRNAALFVGHVAASGVMVDESAFEGLFGC